MKDFKKGITLIEVVLTVALIGIVIPVVFSVFSIGTTSYNYSTNRGFSQQSVRAISDLLTKELRYISRLTDDFETATGYVKFNSLSVDNTGSIPRLIRTTYEYNDVTETVEEVDEDILEGDWKSIRIENPGANMINVIVTQSEGSGAGEATFVLPLTIELGNIGSIETGIDVDLLNIDGTTEKIYYKKSVDQMLDAKVDVTLGTGGGGSGDEGGSGNEGGSGVTIEYPDLEIDYVKVYYLTGNKWNEINNSLIDDKYKAVYNGNNYEFKVEVKVKNYPIKYGEVVLPLTSVASGNSVKNTAPIISAEGIFSITTRKTNNLDITLTISYSSDDTDKSITIYVID